MSEDADGRYSGQEAMPCVESGITSWPAGRSPASTTRVATGIRPAEDTNAARRGHEWRERARSAASADNVRHGFGSAVYTNLAVGALQVPLNGVDANA